MIQGSLDTNCSDGTPSSKRRETTLAKLEARQRQRLNAERKYAVLLEEQVLVIRILLRVLLEALVLDEDVVRPIDPGKRGFDLKSQRKLTEAS